MRLLAVTLTLLASPVVAADAAALLREHVRTSCRPDQFGPLPAGGVSVAVTVDPFGTVRVVDPGPGQELAPEVMRRVMATLVQAPCGRFPALGRNVTLQLRLKP